MASCVQANSFEPPSGTRAPAFWKAEWSIGHLPPVVCSTCCLAWETGQPPPATFGASRPVSLTVLLLDVLAGDGGVALLQGALLDAGPDAALLLPLFEGVEEGLRLVGPVQLAAVVDLREVQVPSLASACVISASTGWKWVGPEAQTGTGGLPFAT